MTAAPLHGLTSAVPHFLFEFRNTAIVLPAEDSSTIPDLVNTTLAATAGYLAGAIVWNDPPVVGLIETEQTTLYVPPDLDEYTTTERTLHEEAQCK